MRIQFRQLLLSWAVSCTCSIALAPPAEAQSFFQKLFGFGGGTPAPAVQAPARQLPAYRFQNRRIYQRAEPPEEDEFGPPDSGGPYRTMCVRACDGFYFPIRHNALRKNFSSDVKSCRNACGDEARLYFYSENGGSIETMTDISGRLYKELPQAFAYRKALVTGCTCKPAPWSYEEAARHRSYAVAEAETKREMAPQSQAAAVPQTSSRFTAGQLPDAEPGQTGASLTVPPEATDQSMPEPAAAAQPDPTVIAAAQIPAEANIAVPAPRRAERTHRRKAKARFARAKYVPTNAAVFAKPKGAFSWLGN